MAAGDASMRRAVGTGFRRAGYHLLKAGFEVVSGVGAMVDEVVKARKARSSPSDGSASVEAAPTRITVE
jgi:hypothetical protein